MTVATQTSFVSYIGNGTTTVFTFPFIGVSGSDLTVYITDPSGNQTLLSTSQYTLVINTPPVGGLWGIGGSVTYPVSGMPIQIGYEISIIRDVPYLQTVSIANQGAFYPQAVEQGLDLLELQIQQLVNEQSYALMTPVTDLSPPNILPSAGNRANGYLAFDDNGQPIILFGTPGGINPSSPRKVSTTGTSILGMTTGDSFGGLSVYQSGTSVTSVQLPSTGGPYPVFDGSLNANQYPIKILPPGGMTILGLPSWELVFNGQSITFYNDGTQILVG